MEESFLQRPHKEMANGRILMGQEIEYKLRAENEATLFSVYEQLKSTASVSEERKLSMHTRYMDTPERLLRFNRVTLRIRQENETQVITVKTPGKNHARGEWNLQRVLDTPFPQPDELSTLVADGAPELLLQLPELYVTCEAKFIRTCCMLTLCDGTRIELAADVGELIGRTQRQSLCELELELYGGSAQQLARLASMTGLPEELQSKQSRALRLE